MIFPNREGILDLTSITFPSAIISASISSIFLSLSHFLDLKGSFCYHCLSLLLHFSRNMEGEREREKERSHHSGININSNWSEHDDIIIHLFLSSHFFSVSTFPLSTVHLASLFCKFRSLIWERRVNKSHSPIWSLHALVSFFFMAHQNERREWEIDWEGNRDPK